MIQRVDCQLENGRQILETRAFGHWSLKGDTCLANGLAHLHLLDLSYGQILALKFPTQCRIKQAPQSLLLLFLHTHKRLNPPCDVPFQQTLRAHPWLRVKPQIDLAHLDQWQQRLLQVMLQLYLCRLILSWRNDVVNEESYQLFHWLI